ncbi:hypothetical protein EDD85DRAFT_954402 [Armillaria nabsnona]|nr:hypothetical protein EDD85DRAFT_954402 [Armillaria nabsnona]
MLGFQTGGDKRYSTNAVLSPSLPSSNIGLSSTNLAASTFHLVQLLARTLINTQQAVLKEHLIEGETILDIGNRRLCGESGSGGIMQVLFFVGAVLVMLTSAVR